jgi:hypothetical protein
MERAVGEIVGRTQGVSKCKFGLFMFSLKVFIVDSD